MKRATTILLSIMFLSATLLPAEMSLSNNSSYKLHLSGRDYHFANSADFELENDFSAGTARLSTGDLVWQTYGYYGIYKLLCVSIGVGSLGFSSGFSLSAVIAELFGDTEESERQSRRAGCIIFLGVGSAYCLSLFGPKIVAHNIRQDDPEAPYNEILNRGLITEAACNATGIGLIWLGESIDEQPWTGILSAAGALLFFIPAPTVMYRTYKGHDFPHGNEPSARRRLELPAASFTITDHWDGSRDWTIMLDMRALRADL